MPTLTQTVYLSNLEVLENELANGEITIEQFTQQAEELRELLEL